MHQTWSLKHALQDLTRALKRIVHVQAQIDLHAALLAGMQHILCHYQRRAACTVMAHDAHWCVHCLLYLCRGGHSQKAFLVLVLFWKVGGQLLQHALLLQPYLVLSHT